jgi:hypothetical protein
MSTLKVFQGSRSCDAPRLCDTCSWGVVAHGPQESEELIFCSWMEKRVAMRIVECTRYYDRTQTPLRDFKEIAWILHVDSKRQKIGFLSAQEWEHSNQGDELVPSYCE